MSTVHRFLYPQRLSSSTSRPQELLFDANLQEFAQRVSYIASLETGGKISQQDSYRAIESLWQQLSASHDALQDR